jgi:hypothetical protein
VCDVDYRDHEEVTDRTRQVKKAAMPKGGMCVAPNFDTWS